MTRLFIPLFLPLFLAIQTHGQDASTLIKEGTDLKKQQKTSLAIEKFREALRVDPNNVEARYELGWCLNDSKQYQLAIQNLQIVRTKWGNVAKVHSELGYAFQKSNKIDSAIASYNRCLAINPTYSTVFKQLGHIAYDKDDYGVALENFIKYESLRSEPIKEHTFWYQRGFTENALKKYTEARVSLEKAAVIKPEHFNTWLELGFAATKLKLAEEAIAYFQKALNIDAKSHIPYNGIGEVYRDVKKDMATAKSWYQKTLNLNRTERKANYGMGYCLNSTKQYAEAIPYLETAITSEPTYAAAFVELGYSLYKTGKPDLAIIKLLQAIKLSPQNENARYYIALVYRDKGDLTTAKKYADELRAINQSKGDDLLKLLN